MEPNEVLTNTKAVEILYNALEKFSIEERARILNATSILLDVKVFFPVQVTNEKT